MTVNERPGALVVAVAIRYSTRNASDATGDDPQGLQRLLLIPDNKVAADFRQIIEGPRVCRFT